GGRGWLGGIQDFELLDQLFCFAEGLELGQESAAPPEGTRDGRDELHDGLMGYAEAVVGDAPAQQSGNHPLLVGKARIESGHQNIGINEAWHEGRDPAAATRRPWRRLSGTSPRGPAGGRWPGRTLGGGPRWTLPGSPSPVE